jgi:septal ring factor EnvC (AmiA/AmiB activator)
VTEDRADLILEVLKQIQSDVAAIRREQALQAIRMTAIEEHQRALMTSVHGIYAEIAELKARVDRIERRIGLQDTEH